MAQDDGWEEVNDPAVIRKVLGAKALDKKNGGGISKAAEGFLNTLSAQAAEAGETARVYQRSRAANEALRPGPNRGRFLKMATPEEGGGALDTIGAALIGAPLRMLGGITEKDTNAYQQLRAYQSDQVLGKQILQKGPQTESDAARLQLTEISPEKSQAVNREIIDSGLDKTTRIQAKATFYTKFANRWGLNGVAPNGMTADQLWKSVANKVTQDVKDARNGGGNRGGGVRVISRRKVR